MPVLRLILAGLIALAALVAGMMAAALVVFTRLMGYMVQLFRPKPRPATFDPTAGPHRRPAMKTDEVIDVVATKVPGDPPER